MVEIDVEKIPYPGFLNTRQGTLPGLSTETYLLTHLFLSSIIMCYAVILTNRVLRLSKTPLSLLWSLYFVIGTIFHICAWLSGDFLSYAFLGCGAIHVYLELLLVVKACESKPHLVDLWATRVSTYYLVVTIAAFFLWQPLNLIVFGSLLVLPADVITMPAGWGIMQRSKDLITWCFGAVWFINGPVICFIFIQVLWGAKTDDNHSAVGAMCLQLQYIIMGPMLIKIFTGMNQDRLGSPQLEQADCVEKGILPSPDVSSEKEPLAPIGMWNAIFWTTLLLVPVLIFGMFLPMALGRLDVQQLWDNACHAYLPGELETMANMGPNFIVPINCIKSVE